MFTCIFYIAETKKILAYARMTMVGSGMTNEKILHELKDPEPEKTVEVSPFYKGIRYDVFVRETGPAGETLRSFDIEMQMEDTKEIPKRARYYQAMCDSESLNKGEVYYNLKELYIMFLCPEDIFGQGKAVCRFKNLEVDNPKIELGDLCFKN